MYLKIWLKHAYISSDQFFSLRVTKHILVEFVVSEDAEIVTEGMFTGMRNTAARQ